MLNAVRRSLRTKVVLIVLTTTLVALVVSTVVLLTYEVRNYTSFVVSDTTTQADILAWVSAPALGFNDPEAARSNLELLGNRPDIRSAAIYTEAGEIFATYSRAGSTRFPQLGVAGARLDAGTLTLFRPIEQNGEVLGTVFIEASYDIGDRLRDYLVILGTVMSVSLLVAAVVSLWLANSVTSPVRAVTDVARQVIERRDFTLRAQRTTEDEIGVLVDAVNTMLAEVGERAAALETSNRALQQETEERRHAEAALRTADQHKDEFLATLAHELRNPLAPMVNAIELLESPKADASLAKRAHDIIRRQLTQMVRLVDDLLDVSRITSGKLGIRKQRVELAQIVRNAVDTSQPLLDQGGHTLSVSLPDEPVFLDADPVRLAQVFSNLLNNAAKYSERDTHISLRTTLRGANVAVRIDDQGIGIAPDTLPRIFDMFTQSGTIERTQTGLGVGLALAQRLVALHGGTIVAESAGPGRGSTFLVTLPVATALTREQRTASPGDPETAAKRHRILVVDDNVDFATSLALLLQNLGHQVRIAHDARQALAVAREMRPEFGFLDLGLPEVTGYELAGLLHSQPETAATVLVAISGWGQTHDRERSHAAGFALHLVKPVELQSIQDALATLVRAG